jgi:hypothetical protein
MHDAAKTNVSHPGCRTVPRSNPWTVICVGKFFFTISPVQGLGLVVNGDFSSQLTVQAFPVSRYAAVRMAASIC